MNYVACITVARRSPDDAGVRQILGASPLYLTFEREMS
jgi:hypothetical protein